MQTQAVTKKKRYRINCPSCERLISSDSNDRPFQVEVRNKEDMRTNTTKSHAAPDARHGSAYSNNHQIQSTSI